MAARWLIGLCGLVAAIAGCGSPAGPVAASPAGIWTGDVRDDQSGSGTARLELVPAGTAGGVTGSYSAAFVGGTTLEGTVSGTIAGAIATFVITPDAPTVCGGGVTLRGALATTVAATDDRLSGRYSGFTCGGARGGQLDLVRP